MARSSPSTSTAFAVETAKDLAEPLPLPPQSLEPEALQYWPAIIGAKRLSAWTETDLILACLLAKDLAALESLAEELATDGHVLSDNKGKKYAHPAANLLDQATRRTVTTCRALQIHAIATSGKTDHQGKKNETARGIASKINAADDDLIARVIN